jgi:hypothetical protein
MKLARFISQTQTPFSRQTVLELVPEFHGTKYVTVSEIERETAIFLTDRMGLTEHNTCRVVLPPCEHKEALEKIGYFLL